MRTPPRYRWHLALVRRRGPMLHCRGPRDSRNLRANGRATVSEHASGNRLQIECLTLGPLSANCYLVTDGPSRQTIIVDPGFAAERILERLRALDTNVAS